MQGQSDGKRVHLCEAVYAPHCPDAEVCTTQMPGCGNGKALVCAKKVSFPLDRLPTTHRRVFDVRLLGRMIARMRRPGTGRTRGASGNSVGDKGSRARGVCVTFDEPTFKSILREASDFRLVYAIDTDIPWTVPHTMHDWPDHAADDSPGIDLPIDGVERDRCSGVRHYSSSCREDRVIPVA